ncbi:MAG: HAD family hydrolase [Peptoniphilaceae bacterium]
MKKEILLFDFDKTLTKEDTIVLLWKYAVMKKKVSQLFYYQKVVKASYKYMRKRNFKHFKNQICQILHYFSEKELIEFTDYVYNNYMLKDGLDYFNNLHRDYSMLVSASPITYLKYFKKYLDFDVIIGTELDKDFNLLGENNKSFEKVLRINKHLSDMNFEIDYEKSKAFSDSFSADRPMLELVKNRYLINSNKKIPGYTNLIWK